MPESLWALLSTVLRVTYDEETDEATAYGVINIGHLKRILDAAQSPTFILSLLSNVSASVVPWLSDDKRLLTDEEYNITIAPTYLAILGALERASDDKAEILEDYGELLAAISTRITHGAPNFSAFVNFWQRVFGDHFDAEQVPNSLRVLLLISGCKLGSVSQESQDQEQVPETPVDTTEEEERQEVSNALDAISDSDDSVRGVPESPVVLRSPVIGQSKLLPVFGETQTTEASDTGSSSISSDEGEEEVPVELPEPALVKKLLRLRKSLSPSRMRCSQSRLPDVTIFIPGDDSSQGDISPVASDVTETPAKETQPRVSTDSQEGEIPPPEHRVLEGLSSSPSSIRGRLFGPQRPSPVVVNDSPLTTMLGKRRSREQEQEPEPDIPSKKRKLIGSLTHDGVSLNTGTVPTGVEVADESRSPLLESVSGGLVSPTVSPKVANKEPLVEEKTPDPLRIEKPTVSVSRKLIRFPDPCMKLILLLAAPLKRKREVEEVLKASNRSPKARSPRDSYRNLEQPSLSKRRRLETWSGSPALQALLPPSDELSSSGMCFYVPFTVREAHGATQTMLSLKTLRGRTTQRRLKAASLIILPLIRHLLPPMNQGAVGGCVSIFFNDLTHPI